MTSTVPTAVHEEQQNTATDAAPLTMSGPDFPFAYDDFLAHPAGLGSVPATEHGTEVAVIGGGLSGIVTAFELMKTGLKPVVYEADQIGGRLRTARFEGCEDGLTAEMGAMRFPPSSTAFQHYVELTGLETETFPNPLAPGTPSTVVDLKGRSHYARTLEDLPPVFHQVMDAWNACLEDGAEFTAMQRALRERDIPRVREIWSRLVERLDDQTFYGFLCASESFASFRHREIFGQVGFGTGGWDTDFPNSILEILRVVYTGADDDHRSIVGGSQQLPLRLWELEPDKLVHWPVGTSLARLHERHGDRQESRVTRQPRPAVTRLRRTAGNRITVTDAAGHIRTYRAAVFTAQSWMLLSKIDCDDALLPIDHWTAVERTHYMESSKLFVPVDRPFWLDEAVDDRGEPTGRDVMSMTLTDRMTRGTYLLDDGPDRPAVICLSYTWCDDSLKWLPLDANQRMEVMLKSLGEIYPNVDIRSHITGSPVTVSWEDEPYFMGAFKANLPGHYRYQRRLFTHFMQDTLPEDKRGLFLAGDDVSWTAGWAEGAVQTALNAVWGVLHHFGGGTDPSNPGPGDVYDEIAPVVLPED
ncbi:amine oxidase [Streptomyces nanshensis]|nr:amine oxidase [Streptomyces nanshensis]